MVTITHGDRVLVIPADILSGPAGAVEAWLAEQPLGEPTPQAEAVPAKASSSKRAAPAKEE